MANDTIRLNQASRNLNVSYSRLAEYLQKQGHDVDNSPNARITTEQYSLLEKAFASSKAVADAAKEIAIGASRTNKTVAEPAADDDAGEEELLIRDPKADSAAGKPADKPGKKEVAFAETTRVQGPKILGKIELDSKNNPVRKPKQEAPKQEAPKKETPPPAPKQDVAPVVEEPVAEAATPATPPPAPVVEEVAQATAPPKAPAKEDAPKHKPEQPAAKEEPEAYEEAEYEEADLPDDDDAVAASDGDDDDETPSQKPKPVAEDEDDDLIKAKATKLKGLKVVGKIELPVDRKRTKTGPGGAVSDKDKDKKRKRKRVKKAKGTPILPEAGQDKPKTTPAASTSTSSSSAAGGNKKDKRGKKRKDEASEQEVDQQVKKTLTQMNTAARGNKSNKVLYRRKKRLAAEELREQEMRQAEQDAYLLRVAEFISTSDLATLMEVDVNEIIMKSMNLGMFISINQRLDAEAITVLADEFGYEVEFTSAEEEVDVVLEEEDAEEDLETRAPIVTIMGHVDHGKTSLLDFIRKSKVAEGEAGGITQHIGAYDVTAANGRRIVFLDTPGHEAFTAMRARGAKVTDVVIIVIAADDSVMPQTVEAINHAQLAGVPYVIAFNKVDKPAANVNRIKEQLAQINVLVDDWGGKVQTQEISAKTGQGIDDLLELVLLESDILELKANPNKNATGTVIEASLDKGRGYVATVLVQGGSLAIGDVILAGSHYGKVKAMNDHRGKRLMKVGPSTPVQVLGLNGAPQAGDKFNALESEREAKEIATKRGQIMREQSIRATKRTTLSDLGRRIALGNFHQLNIIIKGDVDGSIEALSDSLQKLSTEEIEVNILQKAVGPITEGDVLLATASDAIVIGFQVRPVPSARKLAENEEVEVRLYSVIYDAINDVKAAMEGLLSPEIEEIITGNAEVREVFRISRIGTVAGCMITDGTVKRNSKLRVIRDGIVVFGGQHGGEVQALKRFKDDVSEVRQGFECGLSIRGYNDLQVGDVVEAYEERETKRKL